MHSDFDYRHFMIFNTSELSNINFEEVLETSIDTVRKSIDGTKTFIKWDGEDIPSSVAALTVKESPYSYTEMLDILATPEWTDPYTLP